MRPKVLCFAIMFCLFSSELARAEGGEVFLEALGPSSEASGPELVEMASMTLSDYDMFMFVEPEVAALVLGTAGGLATTGFALEGLGEASAHRRYRDAAVEGSDRLSANDSQPISHSSSTSSLRQVARWESDRLNQSFPGRTFREDQLTAIIIAKARHFEITPE